MVVFAKAAEGIVPNGALKYNSVKETYRDSVSANYENLKYDIDGAKAKLEAAGITPADYSFSITVAAYDEVHVAIAEAVCAIWGADGLGFDVKLNKRGTIINNDYYALIDEVPKDMCDDLYAENLASGNFEVIALDLCATTVDPFSVLAPFAKEFAGQSIDMSVVDNYVLTPHITGYDSEDYNKKIEEIFDEKNIEARSNMYADAEAILMDDMPAMPIVHNQYATLISEELELANKFLFFTTSSNYYSTLTLAKAYINKNNYDAYLENCSKWVEDNFYYYTGKLDDSAYGDTPEAVEEKKAELSYTYLNSFKDLVAEVEGETDVKPEDQTPEQIYEQFKKETSIYDFLFK